MIFGARPPEKAFGCILAHKTRIGNKSLPKGHILSESDCSELRSQGTASVVVAQLEEGEIGENEAACRLAHSASGSNIYADTAVTGRVNLYAQKNGVLTLDADAITQANLINPSLTFATLPRFAKVNEGQMVATAKIIPFGVTEKNLKLVETALYEAVSITPFRALKVGLVATQLPHLKPITLDKTRRVLDDRLHCSESWIVGEKRVDHNVEAVARALLEFQTERVELIILFGASAIVDENDVLPDALVEAGGDVRHLGMPVDPGNLLMLGELHGVPVIGAPGCARSSKENGFDWVLNRILADLVVGQKEIAEMSVGGLLTEIGSRPQPREQRVKKKSPRIAAIVLAAGQSKRMQGSHKLLATIDGKSLVSHAVEAALGAGVALVQVVTGFNKENVEAELSRYPVQYAYNENFTTGIASSIRIAIEALPENIDAAVILLADMPLISSNHIQLLLESYRGAENSCIVVATAEGKRGHPVLWDKPFFESLTRLTGDTGAKQLIAENSDLVVDVELGAPARLDIDTQIALNCIGGSLPLTE